MFSAKKRFYKDVSVVSSGGDYEITLDSKKLKTPGGSVLTLGNQSLALAVAHEWQAQKDQILLSQMHLTGLCNTAIDNPTNATKYDLVDDILNFLDTDTLLFFAEVRVIKFSDEWDWNHNLIFDCHYSIVGKIALVDK